MADFVVPVLVRRGSFPKAIAQHLQLSADAYNSRPTVLKTIWSVLRSITVHRQLRSNKCNISKKH